MCSDGTNVKKLQNFAKKGRGLVKKIKKTTLINTPGGKCHFQLAVIMRNAILISSILSCSEVWYGVKEIEYRMLEQTDEMLMKKILQCSSQIPLEMMYLELGLMPIRFLIVLRILSFLQHILKQQHRNSLLFQFF